MGNEKLVSWVRRAVNAATHPIIPGRFDEAQRQRLEYVRYGLAWMGQNPETDLYNDAGRKALSDVLCAKYPDLATDITLSDVVNDVAYTRRNGWVDLLQKVDGWSSGRSQQRR